MKRSIKTIITLLLCLVMTLSLSACGEVQKAETAVNNMFAAFKSLDFEQAQKYTDVASMKISTLEGKEGANTNYDMYMKALFNRLDYKIVSSEKVDSNTVNVVTQITAIDMKPVFGDFVSTALQYAFENAFADPQPTEEETDKKMQELFLASATKPNLATVTNEVTIKVVKQGEDWKIAPDDTFVDAVFGGLVGAAEEMTKSLGQ